MKKLISIVLAQANDEGEVSPEIYNPATPIWQGVGGADIIASIIAVFLHILLIVAGIAALFYFLMGGLQWITSGGDKAGVEAAREKITAAIIGLVIVTSIFAFINFLAPLLGLDWLKDLAPPIPTLGGGTSQ